MRTILPTLFLTAATIISMAGILLFLFHKLNQVRETRSGRGTMGNAQTVSVQIDR
jgi:hypothetical protein